MKYTMEEWRQQREKFREMTCDGNAIDDMMRPYTKKLWEGIEVGDGVTVNYWTDRHAYTVIKRTTKTLTLRRCKATISPSWKPEFYPGGFAGHTANNADQTYTYEEDENGSIVVVHWSEKKCGFFSGSLSCSPGRREFYDFNF
jgi:hypothetical protein